MRAVAILALLTAVWVVSAPTPANAGKTVAVRIETTPEGALVYLGDQDAGALGQTPLELELPPGEHILILEAPGRVPMFESIEVEDRKGKKAKQAQVFSFFLPASSGRLVVDGDDLPAGTRVLIDGKDAGEPPVKQDVDAGAHQVQVLAPGRKPYEEWVEVEGGGEHVMRVAAGEAEPVAEVIAPPRPKPRRASPPVGVARAGVALGWRSFAYDDASAVELRPFDASARTLAYVEVELHPWRRAVANRLLDRLSITGMAGLAPTFTARNPMGMTIDVFWREQAAGLRFRATPHPRIAVDIDAGWMHRLYTFRGDAGELVPSAPDVDYHLVRVGVRGVARLGDAEAWLGADNRIVVSAGAIEDRFDSTEVSGVAGRVGVAYYLLQRHLEARLEGSIERLGWTFTDDDTGSFDGSDTYSGVSLTVGGSY